jgi:hypothetical protein
MRRTNWNAMKPGIQRVLTQWKPGFRASGGRSSGEFDAFMEDLVATLDGFNVGKAEQDELLSNLRPMRADIVEVDSPQVGTPLPSAFTPAPQL